MVPKVVILPILIKPSKKISSGITGTSIHLKQNCYILKLILSCVTNYLFLVDSKTKNIQNNSNKSKLTTNKNNMKNNCERLKMFI